MERGKSNILVSICCITYNHAPFIRKALDGFLMQQPPSCVQQGAKMNDWCEILIHDDCSTDGTTEIVKEYAAKYPDVIFPLYEEVNQYSKGVKVDFYNYKRARGKYIAYCEGDDYWTDPYKLQKQVDFLNENLDYSACFHRVKHHNVYTDEYLDDACTDFLKGNDGADITLDIFLKKWYTQPLSLVFRTSMYDFTLPYTFKYYRDMHEIFYLLKNGKGYMFAFKGGVRNVHHGGIASMISTNEQFIRLYEIVTEWYEKDKDKFIRNYYITTLRWLIDEHAQIPNVSKYHMLWTYFCMTGKIKFLLKFIFGNSIK